MSDDGKQKVIIDLEGDNTPDIPEIIDDNKPNEQKDDTTQTFEFEGTSYKLNDAGDAINDAGEIIKTKDEISTLSADSSDSDDSNDGNNADDNVNQLEIDEDGVINTYTINDNGDAVGDDGVVVYDKEQIEKLTAATEPEVSNIDVKSIIDNTKIAIYNNDGNPVEYENTPESVNKYVEDVYTRGNSEGYNKAYEDMYSKHPIMQNVYQHLEAGGKIDDFKQQVDYSKIKLDKKNDEQLKSISMAAYLANGMSKERAESYYEFIKSTGSDGDEVYDEAVKNLKLLNDNQQQNIALREKDINDAEQARIDNNNNYWGVSVDDNGQLVDLGIEDSIYNVVKTGKLVVGNDTFTIPEKIRVMENNKPVIYNRDVFFQYLYEPITVEINKERITTTRDKYSKYLEDSNRTTSYDVLDSFKRFVGYDDSQLINEKVKEEKVKSIKRIVINNKNKKVAAIVKKGNTKKGKIRTDFVNQDNG